MTRYRITGTEYDLVFEEVDDGEYVLYADVNAFQAENEKLRAALKDLLKCVVQPRQEQAGYSWMMPIIADAKALAEKGE